MSTPFFVQNKMQANLVIDIEEKFGPPHAGTHLDGWSKKSIAEAGNQLWNFAAGPSGYYYLQSNLDGLVVDIAKASTQPGAPLIVYTQKPLIDADNQLWAFTPGPDGYFFIQGKLNGFVIDIEGASMERGTRLDAHPQKAIAEADNQLWQFVDTDGNVVTPPSSQEQQPTSEGKCQTEWQSIMTLLDISRVPTFTNLATIQSELFSCFKAGYISQGQWIDFETKAHELDPALPRLG